MWIIDLIIQLYFLTYKLFLSLQQWPSVTCDVIHQSSLLFEIFPAHINSTTRGLFSTLIALRSCRLSFCVFIIPSEQRFSESSVDQMGGDTNNLSRQLKTVDVNGGGTSKGWQAFQVIFWTWLSLATLIGNGLVLACVMMKKRRNSSTFKFYGSLALGDLLVG